MKIIIAGSRTFNNYNMLHEKMDALVSHLIDNHEPITIISGTAHGADQLGERYATDHNFKIEKYPADWNKFGKSAGYRRNEKMANEADALVAFWDKKSPGTKHMIDIAKKKYLAIRIVYI